MKSYHGVSIAYKKDGTPYYRASITYNQKHISLGSYLLPEEGTRAYKEASEILNGPRQTVEDYRLSYALPFAKYISMINLRNNGIYFKTPIYLHADYFSYHISPDQALKFDRDDLFFYASHTIQQKGGYMFVCHYGSQYSILSRYGIHPFAVEGRDYIFSNGDKFDYRYQNIMVINQYMGVKEEKKYIDAQTAVNYVMAEMQKYNSIKLKQYIAVETIKGIPSADVRENVHGEWNYSYKDDTAECSKCGYEHYLGTYREYATNFCPNCGADMRKDKEG